MTLRIAREADCGAEFHHGLIEISGARLGKQCLGVLPGAGAGEIGGVNAAKNALDVAVDDSDRLGESDAGNGRGGVTADPGKFEEGCGGLRELGVAVGGEFAGTTVQHAGAAVIAEAAPGGEDVIFGGCGEVFDAGESTEEDSVVLEDGGDAGLLKHDFREPDGVGIAGSAPGKVALVGVVPGEQGALEAASIRRTRLCFGICWSGLPCCGHQGRVLLCAISIQPDFCCCHTDIMRCGVEGSGCAPALPLSVMV